MDIIKENMFFVVMGVVVLIALALFVVLVRPLQVKNAGREGDVTKLHNDLVRLLDPNKELPNTAAIKKATDYSKAYEMALSDLEKELQKKRLGTRLPGIAEKDRDQRGVFKTIYEQNTTKLKEKLASRNILTGPEAWHFWDWQEGVPDLAVEGVMATKELFLIDKIVDIIANPNIFIKQLDRLEVNPGETRSSDYSASSVKRERVEPYFDAFPFVLEVRMSVQHYELLIEKLLTYERDIPIIIRSVSMMRIEDDSDINKQVPPLYVSVRVEGWALDYNKKEKTEETADRPGFSGRGY